MKKKTIKLPFGIRNNAIEIILQSRMGVVMSNWIFQGMLYMNNYERLYRLFTEFLAIYVCLLFLNIPMDSFLWIIGVSLMIHSVYWTFNGHIFVLLRYLIDVRFNKERFYGYIESLYARLQNKKFLLGAVAYGSLSKGQWNRTSDFDVRLFRKKGLLNSIMAFNYCATERARAFFAKFPLDIYVFDTEEVSKKIKRDELPIVLYDPAGKIKQRFPHTLIYENVIVSCND